MGVTSSCILLDGSSSTLPSLFSRAKRNTALSSPTEAMNLWDLETPMLTTDPVCGFSAKRRRNLEEIIHACVGPSSSSSQLVLCVVNVLCRKCLCDFVYRGRLSLGVYGEEPHDSVGIPNQDTAPSGIELCVVYK